MIDNIVDSINDQVSDNVGYYGALGGLYAIKTQGYSQQQRQKQIEALQKSAASDEQRLAIEKQRLAIEQQRKYNEEQKELREEREKAAVTELRKLIIDASYGLKELKRSIAV